MKQYIHTSIERPTVERIKDCVKQGRFYIQSSNLSKAYLSYHQALELDSTLPEAHYGLAHILRQWGEWDQASRHYKAVVSLQPNHVNAYFNWAVLSAQQGRYSWAVACYQQLIQYQPDHLAAHLNLGVALIHQEAYDEAADFYGAAITRFPASARLRHNLGQALHKQGDLAGALRHYQMALTLNPNFAKAHCNVGLLWWQHQNLVRARSHYLKGAATLPSSSCLGNLASVALEQGDFEAVIEILSQVVVAMPEVVEAYCQLAAFGPSSKGLAKARHLRAKLLLALQNQSSLQTSSKVAYWLFQIYAESGAIAQESEAFHRAEILYQRALTLQPQAIELYGKLASCLAQQRRYSAAKAILQIGKSLAGPNSTLQFEISELDPEPLPPSQPPNSSCSVTCSTCMDKLIDGFRPHQVAAGVFQIQPKVGPTFPWPTPEICHLDNGRVWVTPYRSDWAACHEIVVTNSTDQRISQGSRQYPWKLPNCPVAKHPALDSPFERSHLPPMETLSGKAVLLSTLSGHVFYHWMIDLLPRLALLQQQGIRFEQVDYFIVNSLDSGFQQETLKMLGVPLERVIESDRHPHLQAEQLIVPDFPGHLDWVPPSTIDFLRSHFLPQSKLEKSTTETPKRIYISRQTARYRRVLNHADVEAALAPYGFVTISLEELTIAQQIQLFAHAEVIVSPHGSGLTHLVFCQPGTQVIELFAPRYIRSDYWMVSQYLNLRHTYTVGRAVDCRPLQELMYQSPLTEDIYVEINAMRSALRLANIGHTPSL